MEPPECPVCLQPYEFAGATVPRVLQCGHSACESCLSSLPRRSTTSSTILCPACNVLVRIPDLGPSALPKNIDLLRFSTTTLDSIPIPNSKPNPNPLIIPLPWTEPLYSNWKSIVLPYESISPVSFNSGSEVTSAFLSTGNNCRVTLVPVGAFSSGGLRRLSYMGRVMDCLTRMGEEWRGKMRLFMDASLSRCRGISRVLGLWMDTGEEFSRLFMVWECFDRGILDVVKEGKQIGYFALMAMEMCEAVIELHSRRIVCGCLTPDCFAFDEYGHCVLDLSRVLVGGMRIRGDSSVSDTAVFVSPEVFLWLQGSGRAADFGFDGFLCYESDVWCLACVMAMMLSGDAMLGNDLFEGFHGFFCGEAVEDPSSELLLDCYETWKEKVVSKLEVLLFEVELQSLFQLLKLSLSYQPQNRPQIKELWICIRSFLTKTPMAFLASMDDFEMKGGSFSCSIIGDICSMLSDTTKHPIKHGVDGGSLDNTDVSRVCNSTHRSEHAKQDQFKAGLSEGLDNDGFMSISLDAHHDCVIALAIGVLSMEKNKNLVKNEKEKSYIHWSPGMDSALSSALLEQQAMGNKGANGWKGVAFTAGITALWEECRVHMTKEKIMARLKTWNKYFQEISAMLDTSGFGWDWEKHIVKVDSEEVWADYIKAHPSLKHYKDKVIINWGDLATLCGTDRANGANASTGVEAANDVHVVDIEDDDVGDAPTRNRKKKKTKRTSPIDLIAAAVTHIAQNMDGPVDATPTMQPSGDQARLEKMYAALSIMPELSESDLIKAIDILLADEIKCRMFLIMPEILRRAWLRVQLDN